MRASRDLKWENKTYKLKRSIVLIFFCCFSKAMEDAVERQRQLTRQRLEARRRKREDQQYEEDIAASIVTMAEKRSALIREKTMMRRAGHKDTVG